MTSRPTGLSLQVALVAGGAAAFTAVLAAVLGTALARGPAQSRTQSTLHRESLLIAQILDNRAPRVASTQLDPVERVLAAEQVFFARVGDNGTVTGTGAAAVTAADTERLLDGQAFTGIRQRNGTEVLVDGEPLATGGGVVLSQTLSSARSLERPLLARAGIALVVAVILAALGGALMARRITRPLRAVADGALALAAGDRGGAVIAGGSAEVAEVAEGLRALDAALSDSEARQRDFLLSVSHELRTPLTTIRGFAESLQDGISDDPPAVAGVIVAESERLERLVGDLLALARLRADRFTLELRRIDAAAVAGEARAAWRNRCAAAGLTLGGTGPPPGTTILADADRLRQILDVLLENALRLTPAPGTVTLEGAATATSVALSVSDTGPGLTDDDLTVAFVPGALHARYAGQRPVGSGVGLALAAELTTRLGGTLLAGSDPGGGARFTAHLPREYSVKSVTAPNRE